MRIDEHFGEIRAAFERLESCPDGHLRDATNVWLRLQDVQDELREIEEYMKTHPRVR